MHRHRNVIPPVDALLIVAGFLISATAGAIVVIVGATLSAFAWTTLSRGGPGGVAGSARGRDRSAKRPGQR